MISHVAHHGPCNGCRHLHMVIERNITHFLHRRARWHVDHGIFQDAKQFIRLHILWRLSLKIGLQTVYDSPISALCP